MESFPLRHAISATHQSFVKRGRGDHGIPFRLRRFHSRTGLFRFPPIHSKQSDYQDFQDYAKPVRLLQAYEVKVCTDSSAEKVSTSFRTDASQSSYKVKLNTSNFSASSLTDLNAGVLLCLIDENGDSILERIPASSVRQHSLDSDNELLHFQRGSVDEFTFKGPKLGRVEAIWIGLESGQWRLGSVSLVVVCGSQTSSKEQGGEDLMYVTVKYEFQAEDILLGEGSDISMLELRPCLVTELSGVDPFSRSLTESTSLERQQISNEESMREYADLKFSLLLYDAMLIFIGTSAASFLAGEHAAFAFLTGGIGGFLYLLLLQRSVDGLSAPESNSQYTGESETDQKIGGFKGPISSFALAIGFALFTVKYSSEDFPMVFTPKELVVGMLGFLACKVAVVLAAFKPVEKDLKINK
ncbi:PLAT/LH2 domain containing protein [Trema orientale]|uniref:PLAT/LH2 domain containing protein n=1 Tax=Trema orientale TaxID=63057 RepID=A0A2P5B2H7_TREOI|nr:PLAT/LH2 domain containing protein [Trema orientale]